MRITNLSVVFFSVKRMETFSLNLSQFNSFSFRLQSLHPLFLRRNSIFFHLRSVRSSSSTVSITDAPLQPISSVLSTVVKEAPPLEKVSSESLQYESGFLGAVPFTGVDGGGVDAMDYLTSILLSRVYDVAIESPLQHAPKFSQRIGVNVWFKREDMQPV